MAGSKAFPKHKEDFKDDDRVTFYEQDKKWILEDENAAEWEWVEETGKWVPSVGSDFLSFMVHN
jgi:hypothetical protein